MPRVSGIPRTLLNAAAALALTLCAGALVVSARVGREASWFGVARYDVETDRVTSRVYFVGWNEGRIMVLSHRAEWRGAELRYARDRAAARGKGWKAEGKSGPPWWDEAYWRSWGPLRWSHDLANQGTFAGDWRFGSAPGWVVALAAGTWPALRFGRWLRRRRRFDPATRPCPSCGYDLRATPDRCPECGALTAA